MSFGFSKRSGVMTFSADQGCAPPARGFGAELPIPGLTHLAPTVRRERPPPKDCGEIGMRIARDGSWHYQGSPIARKELVCLFASVLRREADGYWLVTPAERARITVDDVPFVAVELFHCPGGCGSADPAGEKAQLLSFRTNIDQVISAGPSHPIRMAHDAESRSPAPYLLVRDGLEARISRAVYYELVALAVPERIGGARCLGVWSGGAFFPLGEAGAE